MVICWLLATVVFVAYIADVESLYGHSCGNVSTTCNLLTEDCQNGICKCRKYSHLYYDYGITTCSSLQDTLTKHLVDNICTVGCDDLQQCKMGRCVCNSDKHVLAHHKCYTAIIQEPLRSCGINIEAFICNATQHQYCSNSNCICFSDYYLDKKVMLCEPKSKYMKLHGIPTYKAMIEDYCESDKDCIDGLSCRNFSCACPVHCNYKRGEYMCECGSIKYETPSNVIITGIVLGILSVTFWTCCIKSTIRKHNRRGPLFSDEAIPGPDAVPLNRTSNGDSGQPEDKPPSYEDVIGNNPPIGFGAREKTTLDSAGLAYPLNPVMANEKDPINYPSQNPGQPPYPQPSAPTSELPPYPEPSATNSGLPPYPIHPFQPSAPLQPVEYHPSINNEGKLN